MKKDSRNLDKKFVTICIPVYNTSSKFLKRCFNSVINCGLEKDEFVISICDDGSTNKDTKNAISNFVDEYRKRGYSINLFVHMNNLSLFEARKTMVVNVKTKYVYNLDSDDTIIKNSFKTIKDVIFSENFHDYDIIETGFNEICENPSLIHPKNTIFIGRSLLKSFIVDYAMTGYVWGKFINTEKYIKAFNHAPKLYLNFTEDLLQTTLLSMECMSYMCIDETCKTYNYYRNDGSLTCHTSDIKISKDAWINSLSFSNTYKFLNPSKFKDEEVRKSIAESFDRILSSIFSTLTLNDCFGFDKKEAERMFIDAFGEEVTYKLNESFKYAQNTLKNKQ